MKCAPSDRGWELSVSKVNLTDDGKKIFQRDELVCLHHSSKFCH